MVHTIEFDQDVLVRSREIPVVVDFWATWCKACSLLSPVLELLSQRHQGEWELVKINVEEHPDLALRYKVTRIPSVALFVDGEIVDRFEGVVPGHTIEQWIKKKIPPQYQSELDRARQLLKEGKDEHAEVVLRNVLQKEPTRHDVKVWLARTLFSRDPSRALELIAHVEPVGPLGDLADALHTLWNFRSAVLVEDSSPGFPLLLRAQTALRNDDEVGAFEALMKSLQADAQYRTGMAREVAVALFHFLGEDHELTKKYRRIMGKILYQ